MKPIFLRFLPHPLLTILLAIVWMFLQNKFSYGMLVFGVILGIIIPLITSPWWPDAPKGFRILKLLRYILLVIWDIFVANVQVAWIIVTVPNSKLKSAWISVPIDLKTPEAITMLACTITLTPGTVTADLSEQGDSLLVHILHTNDANAVRDDIKSRYESRLLEIFA